MADRIQFAVSVTPIETLTTENSTSVDVIASEVGKSLGGGGDSVDLDGYEDIVGTQGYLNGSVGYADITHVAGGTAIATTERDFIFVKNTGFKYDSTTTLGIATTDCIMIVTRIADYADGAASGWVSDTTDAGEVHYVELGWLKPGQAMLFPLGANSLSVTQYGANAGDLSAIGGASLDLYARTFLNTGLSASDGNALEFLSVD